MGRNLGKPFASNIHFGPSCWEWMSGKDKNGYGFYYDPDKKRNVGAHRYAYEMATGPIPEGMFVCHSCDNPKCVRHDHLFIGTAADNSDDKCAKNRQTKGESHYCKQKTHCPHGHEYSTSNTYVNPKGKRICRECKRTRNYSLDRTIPTQA